jgi:hypothetical protein
MPQRNNWNPAARMPASWSAAGGNYLGMRTDDDTDTPSPCFFQSFQGRCETVRDYARPQCGSVHALPLPNTGRLP